MRFLIAILLTKFISATASANETASATTSLFPAVTPETTVYALSVVFILTFLLTFYVGVLYFRERHRIKNARALALTNGPAFNFNPGPDEHLPAEHWRNRALTAEAIANNQALLLREKLLPELTDFVKQSLVQGLAAQRDALLAMQQQALQHLAEMEARLASIQAPLQERIRAYETRIVELEKEISSQHNEVRELTRTILQLMRKKLADEQEQVAEPLDKFN